MKAVMHRLSILGLNLPRGYSFFPSSWVLTSGSIPRAMLVNVWPWMESAKGITFMSKVLTGEVCRSRHFPTPFLFRDCRIETLP